MLSNLETIVGCQEERLPSLTLFQTHFDRNNKSVASVEHPN